MGKKRKHELDADVERTMYSSFVSAANAVSQLYTQGVQQQRRAAAAASRATLVSLLSGVWPDMFHQALDINLYAAFEGCNSITTYFSALYHEIAFSSPCRRRWYPLC